MREILFRGKRLFSGDWFYGGLLSLRGVSYIISDTQSLRIDKTQVYSETVGQYTGLTDKNGTKIFEGDVIQTRLKGMNFEKTFRFVIKYGAYIPKSYCKKEYAKYETKGFYALSLTTKEHFQISNYPSLYEVVGNIHDNPELLDGKGEGE